MEKWFEFSYDSILAIFISCVGIYVAIILFTRIFGKRSFSKMSSFDFAMTVAVGSMIASTVLTKSVSLFQGIAGLFFIYLLQLVAAYFRRWKKFQNLIDNTPLLLMDGSEILSKNLRKARVTESDLRSKLREANVLKLEQVKAVIFETTGDIVVLHTSEEKIAIDEWLLHDVARK
ncbi:MAG: YetF domain-containing protein [Christiangramia sp.]